MAETVSTTTNFNLPIDEIIEEAVDIVYGEHTNGYDARSLRRSMNLLMIDLQNMEVPLAHLEERSLELLTNQTEYELPNDVWGVLEANVLDTNSYETPLDKISTFEYFNIANKQDQANRPSVFAFDNTGIGPPKIKVWPKVSDTGLVLKYWVMRKHKDITASYQLLDITAKYLPAITMGLAYFLCFKKADIPTERKEYIKAEYMGRLERAFSSDRDRVDISFYPYVWTL